MIYLQLTCIMTSTVSSPVPSVAPILRLESMSSCSNKVNSVSNELIRLYDYVDTCSMMMTL